jgi:hypothetical protein
MDVSLRLLGRVNEAAKSGSTIRERWVATITAEQLAALVQFERAGDRKADRYRIRKDSFIQVDETIQRGTDTEGNLLQVPAKVADIANTLLGASKNVAPTVFLGTLIWNIRPGGTNQLQVIEENVFGQKGPPKYNLKVRADHAWLTDSAHRHLGIAAAFRQHQQKPEGFPRFSKDYEFVIEIYTLDKAEEKALFYELNALQKRITAAKRKELDTITSAGFVKDAVREFDEAAQRLFVENIEVTAVQNVNHTLMTMSLFVSSIHEMFAKSELDEGKESPQKRADLAEYYCQFFYKLHSTIIIDVDDPAVPGGVRSVKPFYNLYTDIIQPSEAAGETSDTLENGGGGAFEASLEKARSEAKALNALVRSQDITNSNTNIKALCRIGRQIRPMAKWESVIDCMQTNLILPAKGRFFQATGNKDLTAPPALATDVPIAKLNEDGTINVQVQSQTIATLYRYLRRKLELELPPGLRWMQVDPESTPVELPAANAGALPTVPINRTAGGTLTLEAEIYVAGKDAPEEGTVRLAVESTDTKIDWKDLERTGAKRLTPTIVSKDEGYRHRLYGEDVSRYVATFELPVGKAPSKYPGEFNLSAKLFCQDLEPNSRIDRDFGLRVILT